MYRMDGQARIAIGDRDHEGQDGAQHRQSSKAAMNAVARADRKSGKFSSGNFANSGGLPIVINGNQFIGAIGIGGSARRFRSGAMKSAAIVR